MSAHSLVKNTLLLTLSNLVIRLISTLFQVYLTKQIGAASLGLMQLISSVRILAMTLGCSGVRTAAMYLIAEEFGKNRPGGIRCAVRTCTIYGLTCSIAAGLLLFQLAPWISAVWLQDLRAISSLRLMGLFLPVSCMIAVLDGYFTACGKVKQMIGLALGNHVLSILLTILLLQMSSALQTEWACCAIFTGSGIANGFCFLTMLWIYVQDCNHVPSTPVKLRMRKRLLRLCLPLAVNEYLRSGLSTLEHLLIPHGLRQNGNSSEEALSTYGILHGMVFPIISFASAILFSLADVLVPELALCHAAKDRTRIQYLTDRCLRFGLFFACSVAGLLYLLADSLGLLLYHSAVAGSYLRFFAPLTLILYLDLIVDGMHKGLGEQLSCVRYNTLTSFLDIVLLILFLPRYGIAGFLFSFSVTHLLNFYLSLRRLLIVTEYPLPLFSSAKIILLAIGSIAILQHLTPSSPETVFQAAFLGLCYLTSFFLLSYCTAVLSAEDLQWLCSLLPANLHIRSKR